MHSIHTASVSMRGSLFSSGGMVGSEYIIVSGGKCMMTCVSSNAVCVIKCRFIWCIICGPFFIWYDEDSDCILIFFCGEAGPVYGFLYIFFIMWMGVTITKPFMLKGSSSGPKYGVPLNYSNLIQPRSKTQDFEV
jgi:hypothetical protein